MRRLKIFFNSLILGMFVSLIAHHFKWIGSLDFEMGFFIITVLIIYLFFQYFGIHQGQTWAMFEFPETMIVSLISFFTLLAVYHMVPLIVVLGTFFYEITNVPGQFISMIGIILLVIWVVVLLLWGSVYYFYHKQLENSQTYKHISRQQKIGIVLMFIILIILVGGYYVFSPYRTFVDTITSMLMKMDIQALRSYIKNFGIWGPLISILLMVFQSVLAPLPAFIITLVNAYLYNWYFGAALSWTGAMVGALVCFYIARALGRPLAEKVISKRALSKVDEFFNDYGNYTIIILRLLPFVSFDEVSYGAGFTDMKVNKFLIATGIGQLPATIVYSLVGGSLTGNKLLLFIGGISFVVLVVLSLAMKKMIQNKSGR